MQDDRVIQVNNTIPSATYSNLVGNISTDILPASQTADSGQDITIAPQNYIDAYGQLETNLTNAVNAQLNTIGANATAKGAMLTPPAPTQGISSYDYNRWVAPNLNATVAGLRQAGQLLAGQTAMNNMLQEAQDNYNKAIRSARARAAARASSGGGGGGGGGGGNTPSDTVTGVTTEGVGSQLPSSVNEIVYDENGNVLRYKNPDGGWVDVKAQADQARTDQQVQDLLNQANPQWRFDQLMNAKTPQEQLQANLYFRR